MRRPLWFVDVGASVPAEHGREPVAQAGPHEEAAV
jgi:hypothetical protein